MTDLPLELAIVSLKSSVMTDDISTFNQLFSKHAPNLELKFIEILLEMAYVNKAYKVILNFIAYNDGEFAQEALKFAVINNATKVYNFIEIATLAGANPNRDYILTFCAKYCDMDAMKTLARHGALFQETNTFYPYFIGQQFPDRKPTAKGFLRIINDLKQSEETLLRIFLPRYFEIQKNQTPLQYMKKCPEWHRTYLLPLLGG